MVADIFSSFPKRGVDRATEALKTLAEQKAHMNAGEFFVAVLEVYTNCITPSLPPIQAQQYRVAREVAARGGALDEITCAEIEALHTAANLIETTNDRAKELARKITALCLTPVDAAGEVCISVLEGDALTVPDAPPQVPATAGV